MATTPQTVKQPPEGGESTLQAQAKRHLWMHFTRMSAYEEADVPILVRGKGGGEAVGSALKLCRSYHRTHDGAIRGDRVHPPQGADPGV